MATITTLPPDQGQRLARVEALMETLTGNVDKMSTSIGKFWETRDTGWDEFRNSIRACTEVCIRLSEWRIQCEKPPKIDWRNRLVERAIDLGIIGAGLLAFYAFQQGARPF